MTPEKLAPQRKPRKPAMTNYSSRFISFAEARLKTQGEEIRQWSKSENALLAQTCKEILEAAQAGGKP